MKVLMLVQSPVAGDARVQREATTLAAAGHAVTVVGRGVPAGYTVPGVEVLDAGRPPGLGSAASGVGHPLVQRARAVARWALLPTHRERVESEWRAAAARLVAPRDADVLHAHDRNTLALAAAEARRRDVPLVYDAHELWSDRGLPGRPTPLADRRASTEETRLARSAALVLTVSDGIADVLRSRGVRDVRVVRNSFSAAGPAPAPPSVPSGVLYAGRVGPGRDLEALAASAARLDGLRVTLVGPQDAYYGARLRLPGGVDLLPPRDVDALDELYREHGLAAITLTATCRNHELALPNKLFHAVRAGVPVVAADLTEIRRVVTRHGIGRLYRPGDAASLAAAVREAVEGYADHVQAVAAARPALSWEADARVLLEAYRELGP